MTKLLFVLSLFVVVSMGYDLSSLGDDISNAWDSASKWTVGAWDSVSNWTVGAWKTVTNWAEFVEATGRKYANKAEEEFRKAIFTDNMRLVDKYEDDFKKGISSFRLGINPYSDLTTSEFIEKSTGLEPSADTTNPEFLMPKDFLAAQTVPDSFDWRKIGGVTPVTSQGTCGSCYSFAVTAAIEGHVFRKSGKLIPLSQQNLVDCSQDFGNKGCGGGSFGSSYAYVAQKGISKAEVYPYIGDLSQCKNAETDSNAVITKHAYIPPGDEEMLRKVVAILGPVTACVNANLTTFKNYISDIYDDAKCNNGILDHGVLVVGYGVENGKKFWIIKNSWGQHWGENGYMRLARGKNACLIANEAAYPIV